MSNETDDTVRIAELEARVTALGATVRSVLTTLMLRGLLTKAEIEPLIAEAEALMVTGADAAAVISAVMGAEDIEKATRELVKIIEGAQIE